MRGLHVGLHVITAFRERHYVVGAQAARMWPLELAIDPLAASSDLTTPSITFSDLNRGISLN
jgi:hypothetical protein